MRLLDFVKHVQPSYEPDWFHGLIAEYLEAVAGGETNLLVSCPPGHGKTQLVSILFPAWLIAEDTQTHIISLANSDSLAKLASGNILRIIRSPQFQELCPIELDKETEGQFQVSGNDGRPTVHSAGINGQLTGHRAKFLVADDLIRSISDAYSDTVRERVWSNFNSAAETRLLPDGRIAMIHTRWHLDDPIGKLVARSKGNALARPFHYINLAASSSGRESYILDTKTGEKEHVPPYRSLATKRGQPYSFGPDALKGKEADLGPVAYSALYQGEPVTRDAQLFPPECWQIVEGISPDDFTLAVTAWDTASRDKASNDPSANCVVARRAAGDFLVLDYQEFKLTFDRLLPVVMERDRALAEMLGQIPLLALEEASSGMALIDVIRSQFPNVPIVAAKPVHSKIIRAESVTPFTTARSVKLLKGDWNARFIQLMANFPVGEDHCTDAFCHAMRCFTSARGSDFKSPEWTLEAWREENEEAIMLRLYGEHASDNEAAFDMMQGPEDF
jgi:predicted phage terminase large subunit-like protein